MRSHKHSPLTPDPRKGFTLIELLIGMGLAVMLFAVMIPVALKTAGVVEKARSQSQQFDWMTGALYQMRAEAGRMKIDSTASTPTQLVLADPIRPIVYDSNDGKIRRRRGGSTMYLTPDDFPLAFRYLPAAGSVEARVQISQNGSARLFQTTLPQL